MQSSAAEPITSTSSDNTSESGTDANSYDGPSVTTSGTTTTPETNSAACSDGHVDLDEECDDGNHSDQDACLSDCTLAFCGDGRLLAGVEECDDGDHDNSNGCLADCKVASCGDGYVLEGVEECDDGNMDDDDTCRTDCTFAVCGDGVVQAGVEVCDSLGANTVSCDADCSVPECGDGLTNSAAGEECDDGNNEYTDNCYPTCKAPTMLIFATSERYYGNLGGVVGADAKCQALAGAAKLAGTFRAFLSTSLALPGERIIQSPGRYVLRNKVAVANNFSQLASGELLASINITEKGEEVVWHPVDDPIDLDYIFWTGHLAPGHNHPYYTCNDWTSSADELMGMVSAATQPNLTHDGLWAHNCAYYLHRLICVQEPWYGPYPVPG